MRNTFFLFLVLFSIIFGHLQLGATSLEQNSTIGRFIEKNTEKQSAIRAKLTRILRKIKQEKSLHLWWSALLVAFLYGVFHALGPGHGKLLLASFYLSQKMSLFKGFLGGGIFAISHSTAGLLLVVILRTLSLKVLRNSGDVVVVAQKISFGIIILLGIYLLYKSIRFSDPTHAQPDKSLWAIVLSIGLVPCPGSVMIAFFSFRMELFSLGIAMVLAMALGMTFIITALGFLIIAFKSSLLNFFEKQQRQAIMLRKIIGISGSLLMIGFSLLFVM